MKKYEYQTKVIDRSKKGTLPGGGKVDPSGFDQVLNDMGREGWRLVEVVASSEGLGETRNIVCIFERELDNSGTT